MKTYLATVSMYWRTFVVTSVALLAVGLTWLALTPLQYVSNTQLLVSINGSTTATAYQNDDVVSGRVSSYIALLTSDVVSQRVIDKLQLPLTPAEFAAKVSATNVPPKTSIIDVAVTDESPTRARQLAETVAGQFISYADALETPTGEDSQKVRTTVVSAASEPQSRLVERIALGVLLTLAALLLGGVVVWIRSRTDPVVRTEERASAATGVPVVGNVTSDPSASVDDIEDYRQLRTRLQSREGAGASRVTMLISATGEVDATVIASNLARVMELDQGHARVLVAGFADGPEQASSPTEEAPGTSPDSGEDPAEPFDASQGFAATQLTSGWTAQSDQAAKTAASTLVGRWRTDYDDIIFATPPILPTLTASALSKCADTVLLLVVPGTTKRRDIERASTRLIAVGAPLDGLLFVDGENDHDKYEKRTRA